jgi:hypothetical protein
MTTRRMPGFTAETAIQKASWTYRPSVRPLIPSVDGRAVLPQLPKGQAQKIAKCKAGCLGAYLGALVTCAADPICESIADNQYSRCLAKCDMSSWWGGAAF